MSRNVYDSPGAGSAGATSAPAPAPMTATTARDSAPILLATIGGESTDAAATFTRLLAGRTGADVHAISVVEPLLLPEPGTTMTPGPPIVAEERLAERRRAVEAQLARAGVGAGGWTTEIVGGDPAREIAAAAERLDARLIVLARNPRPRSGWWHRVRLALQLLRLSDRPVLVVAPELARLPRRVAVAIDFSPFSAYAAEVGIGLATEDALVHLVHVDGGREFDDGGAVEGPAATGIEMVRALRRALEGDGRRQVESVSLSGDPVGALCDFARAAGSDLVVAGSHGRGFIERLVLGSVSAGLLHRAPCSVLCVPGSAATLAAYRREMYARMRTVSLTPEQWDPVLAGISRAAAGRRCTVEVDRMDLGAQPLVEGVPFAGASYDRHERSVALRLGADVGHGAHLAHVVPNVTRIDVLSDERDVVQAMRFGDGAGHTLVTFMA